jgi:DNA primase
VITVPEDYLSVKFFQFVGSPTKNRYNNTYQGSCPICREGTSWLKKRRFFYIPDKNLLYCHNCGWSGGPIKWLKTVTGMNFNEIKSDIESSNFDILPEYQETNQIYEREIVDTLPKDCINLMDSIQIEFYRSNNFIKLALDFLSKRKLNVSVNSPDAFYISLDDKIHKNRLIIPFYDEFNKIVHYQSRTLVENDPKPRYMSKLNNEK